MGKPMETGLSRLKDLGEEGHAGRLEFLSTQSNAYLRTSMYFNQYKTYTIFHYLIIILGHLRGQNSGKGRKTGISVTYFP